MESPTAVLVDGERVFLNLKSTCFPKQTLVRMGPRLIVGIVSEDSEGKPWQAIYLWRESEGVYRYAHDITIPIQDVSNLAMTEAFLRASTHTPIEY
jgi:hypothetical protein